MPVPKTETVQSYAPHCDRSCNEKAEPKLYHKLRVVMTAYIKTRPAWRGELGGKTHL